MNFWRLVEIVLPKTFFGPWPRIFSLKLLPGKIFFGIFLCQIVMHLCVGLCNPPWYVALNFWPWNQWLEVKFLKWMCLTDQVELVGFGVPDWLCLGCVPEVEGVGDECGELDEDEPLELVSGGGGGAGGWVCRCGCTAGAGGAGAVVVEGALMVSPSVEVLEWRSSCIEILVPCQVLLLGTCRCLQSWNKPTNFVLKVLTV